MSGTKPAGDPWGRGRPADDGREAFLIRWVRTASARLRLGLVQLLSVGVTDTGYVAVGDDLREMHECVPA